MLYFYMGVRKFWKVILDEKAQAQRFKMSDLAQSAQAQR